MELLVNTYLIQGRTGAGKSSLSIAFFRFIEHSAGKIYIDDVDISSIGLYDLRHNLTIIPQDPVLFSGTLRSNLNPLGNHSDVDMWTSLNKTGFLDSVNHARSRHGSAISFNATSVASNIVNISLDTIVEEGGANFSQGQRQLLCLSRALMRQCKVIIMDEATASIDYDTDARIQETIRTEFIGATLLCIAHRLRTIIDYDKILVLEKGHVTQFGTPLELISQEGLFRKMCAESGELEILVSSAESKAMQRS